MGRSGCECDVEVACSTRYLGVFIVEAKGQNRARWRGAIYCTTNSSQHLRSRLVPPLLCALQQKRASSDVMVIAEILSMSLSKDVIMLDKGLSTPPKKELQAIKPNPLQFIPTYQFIQLINSFSVSQQQMDARLGPRPWTTLWFCKLLESDFSTPPTTELQATNRFLYGTH